MNPYISVIIPTYKDHASLVVCLSALKGQTYSSDRFEVIIVNNDPASEGIHQIQLPRNASLVEESRPGSYAARNKGAKIASGDLLAFTDADCQPHPKWLHYIAEAYVGVGSDGGLPPLVAGRVRLFPRHQGRYTFAEAYDYFVGLNQHLYVRKGLAATANLTIPRETFDALGGFDTSQFSGGDTDFCCRANRAGARLKYEERAVVNHPLRSTVAEIARKDRRLVGAKYARERMGTFARAIAPPLVRLKLIWAERESRIGVRAKATIVLAWIWFARLGEIVKLTVMPSRQRTR